jgi:ankyrin repeat protein
MTWRRCVSLSLSLFFQGAIDQERSGAIHRAAREGHLQALEVLLQWKADVNARDRRQVSALHEACKNGHEDCVHLLLHHKADPNCKKMNSSVTNGGFTPLHFAASRGELECMQALVAAGGDVHGGDRAGECPLHVAVRCDSLPTVEWLLSQGNLERACLRALAVRFMHACTHVHTDPRAIKCATDTERTNRTTKGFLRSSLRTMAARHCTSQHCMDDCLVRKHCSQPHDRTRRQLLGKAVRRKEGVRRS